MAYEYSEDYFKWCPICHTPQKHITHWWDRIDYDEYGDVEDIRSETYYFSDADKDHYFCHNCKNHYSQGDYYWDFRKKRLDLFNNQKNVIPPVWEGEARQRMPKRLYLSGYTG